MGSLFTSVAVQWFLRRILDWGGWLGAFLLGVVNLYNALPPPAQVAVVTIVEGHWQDITLGSLLPLLALVWSQVQSFNATVRTQVVTPDKKVIVLDPESTAASKVKVIAKSAEPKRKTLLDRLLGR